MEESVLIKHINMFKIHSPSLLTASEGLWVEIIVFVASEGRDD